MQIQQEHFIKSQITESDYNRARFILRNTHFVPHIRKNWLRNYDMGEIMNCAHHIVVNYENPNFTFNKMSEYISTQKTIKLLNKSIPEWKRAVNAFWREYIKAARNMEKMHNK